MKNLMKLFMCAVCAFIIIPTSGMAQGVTVFADANYSGASKVLTEAGTYGYSDFGIGNDAMSSIKVDLGYTVKICEHAPGNGRELVVTKNVANLAEERLDNVVSTIVITKVAITTCNGKSFKISDDKKIWEHTNGDWVHVGDRCNELTCSNNKLICASSSGGDWLYSGTPHRWSRYEAAPVVIKEPKPDLMKKGGEWSYGYGAPGEEFKTFPTENKEGPEGVITRMSNGSWWSIAQNTSESNYRDNHRINYPAKSNGALVFHPGNGRNQSTKARYTAAGDGSYTFNLKWTLVDEDQSLVSAEVYTNASSVGSGWTEKFKKDITTGNPHAETLTIDLKKGETVSIEVECKNGHANDSTLVEMSVK